MKKRIALALVIIILGFCIITSISWAKDKPITQIQTTVTVTSTAANIVNENLAGQDIFIQNNDTTGVVYLNFSSTATATTTMVRLNPSDSFVTINTTNAVSAIGSISSNANVVVLIGK